MENYPGYNHFRLDVPAEFQEIFSHFYFAQNKSESAITKTLLPSFQTILIFNFGTKTLLHSNRDTQIEIEKCLMLGPIKQSFEYTLPIDSEILVVNFKDDAFYRFFGNASLAEHLSVSPDELLEDDCFITLWNELSNITEINNRIDHILKFCKPYIKNRNAIVEKLAKFNDQALNPIKTIAKENQQSERNIQINHKKHFGYSAKELSRYQRFLQATMFIQTRASSSDKTDWFEIISECGYYDQSQLIHDFRHYTGLSPAKYLKFQQDICHSRS